MRSFGWQGNSWLVQLRGRGMVCDTSCSGEGVGQMWLVRWGSCGKFIGHFGERGRTVVMVSVSRSQDATPITHFLQYWLSDNWQFEDSQEGTWSHTAFRSRQFNDWILTTQTTPRQRGRNPNRRKDRKKKQEVKFCCFKLVGIGNTSGEG